MLAYLVMFYVGINLATIAEAESAESGSTAGAPFTMPVAGISAGGATADHGSVLVVGETTAGTISGTNYSLQVGMVSPLTAGQTQPPACPVTDPPTAAGVPTSRFFRVAPGNPGRLTALRVTFVSLGGTYSTWNGEQLWVSNPHVVTEQASSSAAIPAPTMTVATLSCEQECRDWSATGQIDITHEAVVPGSTFVLEAIDCSCDSTVDSNYSVPLDAPTGFWADVVGSFDTDAGAWSVPDDSIDVSTDVVAVLDKFGNLPGAPSKVYADLEPAILDLKINITDVVVILDAFSGSTYPFDPVSTPCTGLIASMPRRESTSRLSSRRGQH